VVAQEAQVVAAQVEALTLLVLLELPILVVAVAAVEPGLLERLVETAVLGL
jgi:hypothetical protein